MERLQESYEELREKVILQDRLVGIYLIVVINKIDLIPQNERQELKEKVVELLQLSQQIPHRDKWDVQLVSGKTGEGVNHVLDWIISRDY